VDIVIGDPQNVCVSRHRLFVCFGLAIGAMGCTPTDGAPVTGGVQMSTVVVEGHAPSPRPRFVRLTHLQWERSIQDLFDLDEPTGLSETFLGDTSQGGFSTDSKHLNVNPELWLDYQRAAENVAQFVAREPARLSRLVALDWFESETVNSQCLTVDGIAELDECCDGGGKCVPAVAFEPWIREKMEPCQQGGFCAPKTLLDSVLRYGTGSSAPCSAMGDVDGACMDSCFPQVQMFAAFMEQSSCDEGLLCAPCIDPLTQEASGACGWEVTCLASELSLHVYTARRDALIAMLGRSIFRRPLTLEERERYSRAFEIGVNTLGSEDYLAAGVEFVLRVMLQSPYFLYRIERSKADGSEPVVDLDKWEIAARLSLTLWNTTPSEALLDLVELGALDTREGVQQWTLLMLNDLRSAETIQDFHRQLLHTSSYTNIQKKPGQFPLFGEQAGEQMTTEFDLFVGDVLFSSRGGLRELLTASHTFVNEDLAPLYGLDSSGYDASFQRAELDPQERSGLLTRLGFLADRATLTEPDPIRRGVLVAERIICADLPPAPPNLPGLPAAGAPTNRERVEQHTGVGTCGEGCHSTMINPAGFPFEHYDAVGQYRLEDNGYPVNAADVYVLDGEERSYNDAIEFSEVLSQSHQVHACYARHWLEYLYGRSPADTDDALIERIAEASVAGELSVVDLIISMLTSDAFLQRSSEELEEGAQ
jgi:hypothetical protein